MEGPGLRGSRDLLVRRLPPGQLLGAAIGAFVQPAVRVHGHRLPAVLLHVGGLRGLLDELQQPLNPHGAATGEKTCGVSAPHSAIPAYGGGGGGWRRPGPGQREVPTGAIERGRKPPPSPPT